MSEDERTFPAAFDDAEAAYRGLEAGGFDRIAIASDSPKLISAIHNDD